MDVSKIKSVAIYPPLGIARVGNSEEYFLASDIPGVAPQPQGGYKDGDGAFKKQVPLFRVYAFDAKGAPLGELTAGDDSNVTIEWRVHVANRKAGWYQFNNALDIPGFSIPAAFRNQSEGDRSQLIIDPGPRTISGLNRSGPQYAFTGGKFYGKEVPLGEIRTDGKGRLMVFGGDGKSASKTGAAATTFANNDGWHDDVSDGSVRASVRVGKETFEASPAMVVCTPPNFGPGLFAVVTMYDVIYDLFVRSGWLKAPEKITFYDQIFPILDRMCQAQWVNQGFFMLFGHNSPSDFSSPENIKQLSDPSPKAKAARMRVFDWMRDPNSNVPRPAQIPPYYGDLFGDYEGQAKDDLAVTVTQYQWLKKWAEGDFTTGTMPVPQPFDSLSVPEQLAALNKAPFEECLGGPFHPGIEITWPFRNLIMWEKPFRLKLLPENMDTPDDYGPLLAPAIALAPGGPLDGSGPGSLSRWLGVPWQTDEASCLSGYEASNYLPLPSFWAVRVPNQVFSEKSFKRVSDPSLNIGQRLKHFSYRVDWLRDLGSNYTIRINNMISEWHDLGVIARHEGVPAAENELLPSVYWVESDLGRFASDTAMTEAYDSSWEQVKIAENAQPKRMLAAKEILYKVAGHNPDDVRPLRPRRIFRRDEM